MAVSNYQTYKEIYDSLDQSFADLLFKELPMIWGVIASGNNIGLNYKMLDRILTYIGLDISDPIAKLHQNADSELAKYLDAWTDMHSRINELMKIHNNIAGSIRTIIRKNMRDLIRIYQRPINHPIPHFSNA